MRPFVCFFLFCFFFSCTQRRVPPNKNYFSEEKIKKVYLELSDLNLNDSGSVSIFQDSSELGPDESLLKFFPNTEFWRLTIYNLSQWDFGPIPAVVAFSKLDSNDVRILLPFEYAESSKNFFDLFYNVSIKEKDNCCRAITNIFLKTRSFSGFCNKELHQLNQMSESTNGQYIVTTSWHQKCKEPVGLDIYREYTDSVKIKTWFYFKRNKIKEIDFHEWAD